MVSIPTQVLPRSFFERDAVIVARELIGKYVVVEDQSGDSPALRVGRIVETEAYQGPEDLAAHSSRGRRTARTEVMYGPGGRAYVYLIYGIHHCFNIVTSRRDVPHAVLIRALEPILGVMTRANGPGLVASALGITRSDNGCDLRKSRIRVIAPNDQRGAPEVATAPRINIGYAGQWVNVPWRFIEKNSPFVSRDEHGRTPPKSRPSAGQKKV